MESFYVDNELYLLPDPVCAKTKLFATIYDMTQDPFSGRN